MKKILLSFFAFMFLFGVSVEAKDAVYTAKKNNLAVSGYDTVAYFNAGAPAKGFEEFSTEYNGATWFFSSQENLDLFTANPGKYAPEYGGYCAYATAKGKLVKADPEAWNITDGKLYLNYNKKVREKWLKDKENYISIANQNFPDLIK